MGLIGASGCCCEGKVIGDVKCLERTKGEDGAVVKCSERRTRTTKGEKAAAVLRMG